MAIISHGKSKFNFVRNCQTVAVAFFILTWNEWEVLLLHILGSIWGCQCLDIGYSNRCVAVFHCCFTMHFPDDLWHGTSFHMLVCHLCIFFDEESVKIFNIFKSDSLPSYHWILRFLCVFWIKILHHMSFTNIFSKPVLSSNYFNIVFHRV